jgi:hypothetical protein
MLMEPNNDYTEKLVTPCNEIMANIHEIEGGENNVAF